MNGRDAHGRFLTGSAESKRLGKKGGTESHKNGRRHKLTFQEMALGGRNSHLSVSERRAGV